MPYIVVHRTGKRPWKILREDTRKIVGSSVTEEEAKASVRARYAAEDRKKKTGR